MEHKDNDITILHNTRCKKSRETLEIIRSKHVEPTIIDYLKEVPSKSELKEILTKLGMKAHELVRKGEPVFKTNYKGKQLTENEWIDAMIQFPKLIERPIVIKDEKAIIGRPPAKVLQLIK